MDGTIQEDGTLRFGLEKTPDTEFQTLDRAGAPHRMTFIDHDESETAYMGSIQNQGEANIVSSVVLDILINNPVSHEI